MKQYPSVTELQVALSAAGSAHHEYEVHYLKGVRDELWSGFYAAYVLGKLGGFVAPTQLARWLESAPGGDNWSAGAASYVVEQLETSA